MFKDFANPLRIMLKSASEWVATGLASVTLVKGSCELKSFWICGTQLINSVGRHMYKLDIVQPPTIISFIVCEKNQNLFRSFSPAFPVSVQCPASVGNLIPWLLVQEKSLVSLRRSHIHMPQGLGYHSNRLEAQLFLFNIKIKVAYQQNLDSSQTTLL